MKVLWITNIALPETSLLMNEKPLPFGGWLVETSIRLADQEDIKLSISFPKRAIDRIRILQGKKITYYAFPTVGSKNIAQLTDNKYFEQILNTCKPDIVHIFGTEYAHTLAVVNVCKKNNIPVVISIQGLVSVYAQHYTACLPEKVQKSFTFKEFIKQSNIKQQQKDFIKRGKYEISALQKVNHVIGRTTWDKACIKQINPKAQYHYCSENLRPEFYKHVWDLNKCEKHSIFVSQGSYPIKGLHFVLEAMPLILNYFPDTKLYIGGYNIIDNHTFMQKLKMSSYGRYLREIIRKNMLQGKIIFTGLLDEKQMCERYLKANVFVLPSTIENSPNSLGEAMILGLPCVSSAVGGVLDLMKHKEEGFIYQSDAPYMLAHYICEVFSNNTLALDISKKARTRALKIHDVAENTRKLLSIYKIISQ